MRDNLGPGWRQDFAILCLMNVCWAPVFFFLKDLRAVMSDTGVGLARFGYAASFFWLVVWSPRLRQMLHIRMPVSWGERIGSMVIGAALVAPAHLMYFWGLSTSLGTEATLLGASGPIILALAGAAFLSERLTLGQWIGVFLGFVGVYGVVTGKWAWIELGSTNRSGNLLVLSGFVLETTGTLLAKPLVRRSSGLGYTVWSFTGNALVFLSLTILWNRPMFTAMPEASDVLKLLYLAVFSASILWAAWFWVMERLPVGLMGVSLYCQQIAAALLGYLVYSDRLAAAAWQGGLLILFSIWLCTRKSGTRREPAREAARGDRDVSSATMETRR